MSKANRRNSEEKLIARWEQKLERLGLGVLEPLCSSEEFARLHPRKLDKCQWYDTIDDTDLSAYRKCLHRALKKLPYREQNIVILHIGIGDDIHCYTFAEIGYIFKITRVRVQQLYEKATQKLSDYITHDVVSNRILL